tara:strand:- start:36 stop:536 length:501 start_codon:yes stop_codon:yes gene_type:complete
MKIKKLSSKRLDLIPLGLNHLSISYVNWMNDKDVIKHLESGGDYDMLKLKIFLSNVESSKILFWAIMLKDKHIGNIKIDPVDTKKMTGEYGILIGDKNSWSKGYAIESSKTVIDYCFYDLGIKKIELGVISSNIKAINLYQKIGFKEYKRLCNNDKSIIRMYIKNE